MSKIGRRSQALPAYRTINYSLQRFKMLLQKGNRMSERLELLVQWRRKQAVWCRTHVQLVTDCAYAACPGLSVDTARDIHI